MEQHIHIETENTPTVLGRVVQTVKRKQVTIRHLYAAEVKSDTDHAVMHLTIEADAEQKRLLVMQLGKIIDVIKVR